MHRKYWGIVLLLLVGVGAVAMRQMAKDPEVDESQEEVDIDEMQGVKEGLPKGGELEDSSLDVQREYVVVATGQSACSDNRTQISCPKEGEPFYGQDAQYDTRGFSYTDNQDKTVTDNLTGLMWTQEVGDKMLYSQAVSSVDQIETGGYDDWRLPTIKELFSLMNFNGTDPSGMQDMHEGVVFFLDTQFFDFSYGKTSEGDRLIDSQWVTQSLYQGTVMGGNECFFGVNFADGRIKCYPTSKKMYYVRYVRGSQEYGNNAFVDQGEVVFDSSTGLSWQKSDSQEGLVWEDALAYCQQLEVAGYDDWRLPDIKELQSIVDYSRSPDKSDSAALDSVFEISSIQNEARQQDYPFFWSSTTHITANGSYANAAYIAFGRALGYMNQFEGWVDVHGAGAQRSDPKEGSVDDYPQGHGPQGDARRIYNYVRCVRGGV